MKRTPLEFADLYVGEPEPKPRARDVVAALVVFVVLTCLLAFAAVGFYMARVG